MALEICKKCCGNGSYIVEGGSYASVKCKECNSIGYICNCPPAPVALEKKNKKEKVLEEGVVKVDIV